VATQTQSNQVPRFGRDMRTPAQRWAGTQACLLAIEVLQAWAVVARVVEKTPEAVLLEIQRTGVTGMKILPHRRQIAMACRRRDQRLGESAAGARLSPTELELWPEDALALHARKDLRRRPGLNGVTSALVAAVAVYQRFRELDQQAAAAPSQMDELRRRKGA
jgi:hypothetical protein